MWYELIAVGIVIQLIILFMSFVDRDMLVYNPLAHMAMAGSFGLILMGILMMIFGIRVAV